MERRSRRLNAVAFKSEAYDQDYVGFTTLKEAFETIWLDYEHGHDDGEYLNLLVGDGEMGESLFSSVKESAGGTLCLPAQLGQES